MARKSAFMLATTVAIAATVPQIAYASCGGSACSAYTYADGKFTNTDTARQVHLTGCFMTPSGVCGTNFDITVDAHNSKAVTVPAGKPTPKLDVKSAVFIGSPAPASVQTPPPNLRLKSPAELEKEIDDAENDLVKVDGELSKVDSKEKLEELKKRVSKDRETIDRVKTILNGPLRSVIETTPSDWTTLKKKTTDTGAKVEAIQKRILGCVLTGDVTGGDAPGRNVPAPTNIDPSTPGKHVVGCKKDF
jgi:hypothetical protein